MAIVLDRLTAGRPLRAARKFRRGRTPERARAELLAGAVRPHRGWTATYLSFWVQAYNTNLVRKADLPRTYQDLLNPKWREWWAGGLKTSSRFEMP